MKREGVFFNPLKDLVGQFDRLIKGRLWLKVLLALVLGVISGILLGPDLGLVSASAVKNITSWLALPGQVFLAIIQMIVVPLVVASIVKGLAANNNPAAMKKSGTIAVLFIIVSTMLAASIGIVLALNIQPGSFVDAKALSDMSSAPLTSNVAQGFPALSDLPDKVSALIPRNPLASMASGEMLQVILFAAVLGAAFYTGTTIQTTFRFIECFAGSEFKDRFLGHAVSAISGFWFNYTTCRKFGHRGSHRHGNICVDGSDWFNIDVSVLFFSGSHYI